VATALPYDSRPQLADALSLLTSELLTNAVLHGPRPAADHLVDLVLWPADGHYWLAVSDAGDGLPVLGTPSPGVCGGRGLVLVDALSAAWGVVPRRTSGKSVVAGIRLPGS
jgi:two-component sensor histidine kinase